MMLFVSLHTQQNKKTLLRFKTLQLSLYLSPSFSLPFTLLPNFPLLPLCLVNLSLHHACHSPHISAPPPSFSPFVPECHFVSQLSFHLLLLLPSFSFCYPADRLMSDCMQRDGSFKRGEECKQKKAVNSDRITEFPCIKIEWKQKRQMANYGIKQWSGRAGPACSTSYIRFKHH